MRKRIIRAAAVAFESLDWIVIVAAIVALLALAVSPPRARAAVDAAGRPWSAVAGAVVCPAADQFAGVQFVQLRPALPGAWLELRAGGGRSTGSGGVAFALASGTALRAGVAVSRADDDLQVDLAVGATAAVWRRLTLSAGWDAGTDAATVGFGFWFWRPADSTGRPARRRRKGCQARAPIAYCDRCQQPAEPDDLTDRGDLGRICDDCATADELRALLDDYDPEEL